MDGENTGMAALKPDDFRTISGRFPDKIRTKTGEIFGEEIPPAVRLPKYRNRRRLIQNLSYRSGLYQAGKSGREIRF
jgi:hypothetical protein